MNKFVYNIMSDIIMLVRKNMEKIYVFIAILLFTFIISLMLVFRETINPYYKTGLYTGFVIGLRAGQNYFFMLILWNVLSFGIILGCTCNDVLLKCWPLVFGIRIIFKLCDIFCAIKYFFFSCILSAIVCVVFELIILALLYIIYLELTCKSINVFRGCEMEILREVTIPVAVIIVILTAAQSILVGLLLF